MSIIKILTRSLPQIFGLPGATASASCNGGNARLAATRADTAVRAPRATYASQGPLGYILKIRNRRLQRRMLATLSDRMLDDIGVSRSDAYRESRKPFWVA